MFGCKIGDVKILDCETNGFLEDFLDYSDFPYKLKPEAKKWVVSVRDLISNEVVSATKENITKEWLEEQLKGCKVLVAHNGIKFDFPFLKLLGVLDYSIGYPGEPDIVFGQKCKIVDTLVLSRLLNPDRNGGHSLDSWGERTGATKQDFRGLCIEKGYIDKGSPKGEEFKQFVLEMVEYCEVDTLVNRNTFIALIKEMQVEGEWKSAFEYESKLADLGFRREHFGFYFDKELAVWCVNDLTEKMNELEKKVNPFLPKRSLNKTEEKLYTPPKQQIKKDGDLTVSIINFAKRLNANIIKEDSDFFLVFENKNYLLPISETLKTEKVATIDDMDHVKQTLIDVYGWEPSEWRIRDLTVDSKKKKLSYKKRIAAFKRWLKETMEGKYQKHRLEIAFEDYKVKDIISLSSVISEKLKEDWPVRVPTAPPVKVGVTKEICPNLIKLGSKVDFAKDFADYLTYKDRRSNIAGGDLEGLDLTVDKPKSGYLKEVRDVDGRIPTPANELGTNTFRYSHSKVVNIPRISSLYGENMRKLFGSGKGFLQLGFDFSSLENRIQGHYILKYPGGKEEAESLIADKPFDAHTVRAKMLGISRDDVKSVAYAITYGSSWKKIGNMLNYNDSKAKQFYNDFWKSAPALKALKDNVEDFWENKANKEYIPTIDGRLVRTRSKHSLLNALFQSAGVIFAKYVTVDMFKRIEKQGYNIDPFKGKPDVGGNVENHDECQLSVNESIMKIITFNTEEEVKKFKAEFDSNNKYKTSGVGFKNNVHYLVKPNFISETITDSIEYIEKKLKLKVEMGFDWDVGRNWADCH